MTAEQLATRVVGSRKSSRGWLAKCPAHDDRGPSLSIAEGRDGRTLVRCFAGCEPDRVVAALGLELRDLFARDNSELYETRRRRREPTPAEIRDELTREADAVRRHLRISPSEELLPSEKSEIRRRVAGRLGITLAPIPRAIWEGNYGGRERDPLWPIVFERAWDELWIERGLRPPYDLEQLAREGRDLSPRVRIFVEERAITLLRSHGRFDARAE